MSYVAELIHAGAAYRWQQCCVSDSHLRAVVAATRAVLAAEHAQATLRCKRYAWLRDGLVVLAPAIRAAPFRAPVVPSQGAAGGGAGGGAGAGVGSDGVGAGAVSDTGRMKRKEPDGGDLSSDAGPTSAPAPLLTGIGDNHATGRVQLPTNLPGVSRLSQLLSNRVPRPVLRLAMAHIARNSVLVPDDP